ncbi:MAG TPA: hypothetical protein PKV91_06245 [Bacillota bacterium]|jgi:hypothetical protein|nr:hypothetical protein [Bacillota bacterium]HOJ84422.1 hypothetical protein [Bacillota bacterium]HOL15858.1 hypothetical protein [Bacillota bacterium]HPZ11940.1 hypothetical protein [Bacillota bacterium]HQE10185.1 hypothetical protein [Bacillota bacterium]
MKMTVQDIMHKGNTTSWAVAGLGLVVAGIGRMVGGNLGAGLTGFGLAHVVLGLADMFRQEIRN